jgi:hypothetical protein
VKDKDPFQAKLNELTDAKADKLKAIQGSVRVALRSNEAKTFVELLEAFADSPSYAVGLSTSPTDVAFFEGRRQLAMTILRHANLR